MPESATNFAYGWYGMGPGGGEYITNAQRAVRPIINLPTEPAYNYNGNYNYGGGSSGGTTLSSLRNMSPESLLGLRTKYRIEERAPALAENARQFDVGLGENARQFNVGNEGTNERYYSGLGENARQYDLTNVLKNDQYYAGLGENARQFDVGEGGQNERYYSGLANQQLLAELEAWSRMLAGLPS